MSAGAGEFTVSQHVEGGELVIVLGGEFDVASAGRLREVVDGLRPLTTPLAVDITEVTFLDSAGLRALLTVGRDAVDDTGEPLRLRGVGEEQYRLLELCGLVDAFSVAKRDAQ